jgi:Tfp pilus assembly protein PilV
VLVVFFIFLAGVLAVLATSYSVQLARTTRQHHQSIVLRQMADSAHDWLAAQPNWRTVVPTVLDMKSLVPDGTSGTIRIRADEAQPDAVVIEAQLTTAHRQRRHTTSFKLPS